MLFKQYQFLALFLISGTLLHAMQETHEPDKNFLKLVIENPVSVLDKIEQTGKLADVELEKVDIKNAKPEERCKIYREITRKCETDCPIFLLEECRREEFSSCVFSRKDDPIFRQKFEDKVVEALVEKINNNPDRSIQYVSFGPGGCFQDLVIIAKALAQNPKAKISIHLIDPSFEPYIAYRKLQETSHIIFPNRATDFTKKIHLLIKHAKKTGFDTNGLSDAEIEKRLLNLLLMNEERTRQFIKFLKKEYPQAQLLLYIHQNTKDYLEYIKKEHIKQADVLAAADIQDEMSLFNKSILHYCSLCSAVFKKNPNSNGFLLGRTLNNPRFFSIMSFGAQNKPDSLEIECDDNLPNIFMCADFIKIKGSNPPKKLIIEEIEKEVSQEEEEEEGEDEEKPVLIPNFNEWD
ncbi:MAG: hypothetical protein ABH827_06010 [bacterium]